MTAQAYLGMVAMLLLVLAGLIVVVFHLRNHFWGLALLITTAVAFPMDFRAAGDARVGLPLLLTAFICVCWLFEVIVMRRGELLHCPRVVYATFAFMTVATVAFVAGQFPWYAINGAPLPAQIGQLGIFLLSGFLFLAVGFQLRNITQLKWLTWIFCAAGLITAVTHFSSAFNFISRLTTQPGSVGSMFWTWLAALSFSQAVFNTKLAGWARLAMLIVTGTVLYHSLVQVPSWASGWVPALIAIGVILGLRLPRFTIGAGLVCLALLPLIKDTLLSSIAHGEQYSIMTRDAAVRTMWQLIERSPVIGLGLANYYYYTVQFPILGWYVNFLSHNNYLDLLAQVGILGVATFAWLAIEIALLAWRLYFRLPSGFAKAYTAGALGGLVATIASGMLGDWLIPFYYNSGLVAFRSSLLIWFFLGGVLALDRMYAVEVARHYAHNNTEVLRASMVTTV